VEESCWQLWNRVCSSFVTTTHHHLVETKISLHNVVLSFFGETRNFNKIHNQLQQIPNNKMQADQVMFLELCEREREREREREIVCVCV
jgi:hypothetical protein